MEHLEKIKNSQIWLDRYETALKIRQESEYMGADIDADESGASFNDTYVLDVEDLLSHLY